MTVRYLGYGGLGLLLLSLVLFLVSSTESRYESGAARLRGRVIAKDIRPLHLGHIYGVTYRVTVESRTVEREGDVGSRKAWDSFRIGDEVEVESVGVTPNETRLPAERSAGSGVYRGIAAALGLGGVVLLLLRVRASRRRTP
ncbi:MAG: hypothetical protein HY293_10290 [Planctomycetes bacterium]|nr:hypothetical protein [Planctomycetota bacterium]